MAVPWQGMNKIRSQVRSLIGRDIDERFFTLDRDSGQIVSNQKIECWHFIFDADGKLIKKHRD